MDKRDTEIIEYFYCLPFLSQQDAVKLAVTFFFPCLSGHYCPAGAARTRPYTLLLSPKVLLQKTFPTETLTTHVNKKSVKISR